MSESAIAREFAERSEILLSICIPTFNRGHTLHNLLKAVQVQLHDAMVEKCVEVVISDNASTDDTEMVVREFAADGLPIRYFRQESNLGFGKNLNNAVALAKGRYCWLMGSDDVPAEGALATVLERTAGCPDVMIGNVLTSGKVRQLLTDGNDDIKIEDRAGAELFVSQCLEISSLFAFMSALIIRRDYWNAVEAPADMISHPYTHQLRLFSALAGQGANLHVIRRPIVDTGHEGNEWDAEIGRHFELDCRTLELIATTIFNDDDGIFRAFGEVFRRQYGVGKFVRSRACLDHSKWSTLEPVLKRWGYPNRVLKKKFYDFVIYWSYKSVKMAKRSLK